MTSKINVSIAIFLDIHIWYEQFLDVIPQKKKQQPWCSIKKSLSQIQQVNISLQMDDKETGLDVTLHSHD
jgi:hypothetical protein